MIPPDPHSGRGRPPPTPNTQPGLRPARCWDPNLGPPQLFSRGCAPGSDTICYSFCLFVCVFVLYSYLSCLVASVEGHCLSGRLALWQHVYSVSRCALQWVWVISTSSLCSICLSHAHHTQQFKKTRMITVTSTPHQCGGCRPIAADTWLVAAQ